MNTDEFCLRLKRIIEVHFNGMNKLLAEKIGEDPALISRVLRKERDPTPLFVGRIAGALAKTEAHALCASYLAAVAAEVAENQLASQEKIYKDRKAAKVSA